NILEVNGSRKNNLVYSGPPDAWSIELGSVFRDPVAKAADRFKMIHSSREGRHVWPFGEYPYVPEAGVLKGAYSADGLNWTTYPAMFLGRIPDTQSVATYDPTLQKYVAYVRHHSSYGGLNVGENAVRPTGRGAGVGRMESWNFAGGWSYPEPALMPDFTDGLGVELYNPGYLRYPGADNAHFLFPSAIDRWEGTLKVKAAVSRDGRAWLRPNRDDVVPLGPPGSFDSARIYFAPDFVAVDRDHYAIYYRGANDPHGGSHPSVKPANPRVEGMGRVLFKRDRILGIEARPRDAVFSPRPLVFEGRRLVLNVEPTGPDPRLQVQLIGAGLKETQSARREDAVCPGYSLEESIPLASDELDGVVRWRRGPEVAEWEGKPVRLHFRMKSMRIYAFQFLS
ncbi:MAG: hypothetical protein NTY38_16180, partial [Acidobacteria bacterium]|nr:hypothetical protein [Acidobacteriota bacterium]